MFIHDIESGKNFFNQKSIGELLGLPQSNVSYHLNQFKARRTDTKNLSICLKTFDSDKPVEFHPFRAVSYVAYKSKSPEAEDYLDYLEDALDTKFNRKNGFTKSIEPTREEKILSRAKKQQAQIRMETDSLYVEIKNTLFTTPFMFTNIFFYFL